ncbi:MAG: hypothetical protein RIC38_17465 [Chromatocurvus sp.]
MTHNQLVAIALACGVTFAGSASAQMTSTYAPINLYGCVLNDDSSWDDVAELDKDLMNWMKKSDPSQSLWQLTPQWRGAEGEFDLGYLGAWESGKSMGEGMAAWTTSGREVAMAYGEKMECSHSLMASMTVIEPATSPPGDGVIWFSECTLADGATLKDAAAAHKAYGEAITEKTGMESGGAWMFMPTLGTGDLEFDYYHVAGFDGYAALGSGFDAHFNEDGWKAMGSAYDGVVSCTIPNVYDVKAM